MWRDFVAPLLQLSRQYPAVNLDHSANLLQTPAYSVDSQPSLGQADSWICDAFGHSLDLPSQLPPPGSGAERRQVVIYYLTTYWTGCFNHTRFSKALDFDEIEESILPSREKNALGKVARPALSGCHVQSCLSDAVSTRPTSCGEWITSISRAMVEAHG